MVRSLTFRLCTACAAVAFAITGGLTGMDSHPPELHGPQAEAIVGLGAHHAPDQTAPDRDAHASHPQHGSGVECRCVGPCEGGASPTLPDLASTEIAGGEADDIPVLGFATLIVWEDPASYLFPLPNAPPARV